LTSCFMGLSRMGLSYKRTPPNRRGLVLLLEVSQCLSPRSECLRFQFSFLFFLAVVLPIFELHGSVLLLDLTRETFDFFKPCDTFKLVFQPCFMGDDEDVCVLDNVTNNLQKFVCTKPVQRTIKHFIHNQ